MPYVCVFADCSVPNRLFDSRHDWFLHLHAKHIPSLDPEEANSCLLRCGASLPVVLLEKHLGRHLEELALFALPRADVSDDHESDESQGFARLAKNDDEASSASSNDSRAVARWFNEADPKEPRSTKITLERLRDLIVIGERLGIDDALLRQIRDKVRRIDEWRIAVEPILQGMGRSTSTDLYHLINEGEGFGVIMAELTSLKHNQFSLIDLDAEFPEMPGANGEDLLDPDPNDPKLDGERIETKKEVTQSTPSLVVEEPDV